MTADGTKYTMKDVLLDEDQFLPDDLEEASDSASSNLSFEVRALMAKCDTFPTHTPKIRAELRFLCAFCAI